MRAIERRLAAVEAKRGRSALREHRLILVPREVDEGAFIARSQQEPGDAEFMFIIFVAPEDMREGVIDHHRPRHHVEEPRA